MKKQIYCHVDNCGRLAMYKNDRLCQKHYFRRMRTGVFYLRNRRKEKLFHSNGYIKIYNKDHPLSDKFGYVYEHRAVIFEVHGHNLPCCQFCGRESDWRSRNTHIDHIDCDRANNDVKNLRVLCNACNTKRPVINHHLYDRCTSIEIDGKTMTAQEWSRQPNVFVSGSCIRHRLKKGMSGKDAVFSDKKTHRRLL